MQNQIISSQVTSLFSYGSICFENFDYFHEMRAKKQNSFYKCKSNTLLMCICFFTSCGQSDLNNDIPWLRVADVSTKYFKGVDSHIQGTTLTPSPDVQYVHASVLSNSEKPFKAGRISNTSSEKLLILRTFAKVDFQNLISGFESWDEFTPCVDKHQLEMNVDILLFFSSSWSQWPAAQEAAEYVYEMFSNNSFTWARCFGNLYLGSALIDHGEDIYSPKLMGVHEKWVNGPNRQFERAMRAADSRGYDLVYLMEVDSTPIKHNWLNNLVAEIESRKPFAVLGRCLPTLSPCLLSLNSFLFIL